jgi:hypothetical protein
MLPIVGLGIVLSHVCLFIYFLLNGPANGFTEFFFQLIATPTAARLGKDVHLIVRKFGNPQLHIAYPLWSHRG